MRCYHFGNFYLSSIQQGIQSAHAQMELFVKYNDVNADNFGCVDDTRTNDECIIHRNSHKLLYDWAENHKTMICLNGGMAADLLSIENVFNHRNFHANPYPWASFREEEDALNSTITNVAIVLPERIYETASVSRSRDYRIDKIDDDTYDLVEKIGTYPNEVSRQNINLTEWEYGLINILNSCRLAS